MRVWRYYRELTMPQAVHRCVPLFFVTMLLASFSARAQQSGSIYSPLPVFELHSGFWINLHHTLYYEAKLRAASASQTSASSQKPAPSQTPASSQAPPPSRTSDASRQPAVKTMRDLAARLTPAERAAWDAAVSFYAANYASKDLLFNNDLVLLKNQLEDFEDCDDLSGAKKKTCDAGLPVNITKTLESAAAPYRAHLWAEHDRANRRWVARVAPLVEEQGVGISERLADIYQAKWPGEKIRVDVSAYANWAGAYTTIEPLRVTISSTDTRNQDDQALEVLFHEASHGIAEPVQSAIARECRQRGKAIPRDLWHALIFYTTGEVIRPVMSNSASPAREEKKQRIVAGSSGAPSLGAAAPPESAPDIQPYTPYAIREGLYQRGWNSYFQLLTRFWQPYLDSKATFDDAIARMVSSL